MKRLSEAELYELSVPELERLRRRVEREFKSHENDDRPFMILAFALLPVALLIPGALATIAALFFSVSSFVIAVLFGSHNMRRLTYCIRILEMEQRHLEEGDMLKITGGQHGRNNSGRKESRSKKPS